MLRGLHLVPIALVLVLAACSGASGPGDAASLVATLPADVDLAAFVDVKAVQEHPLWKKVAEDQFLRAGEEPLKRLEAITGLDPARDLQMLLFAARALGQPGMEIAVIARGTVDRERIEDLLEQAGWRPERHGSLSLYALPGVDSVATQVPGLGTAPRLTFIDDFTVALGPAALLEALADVQGGSAPALTASKDLGPLLDEALGSGQFWGVFRSGYLAEQLRQRIESGIPLVGVLKGFSGVEAVRFSLRFSDSIDLVARPHASTEDDARLLADTLNGFLALAKLVAKDRPEVLRFLEGALVGLDLNAVRLSMNIDGATLDRIRGGLLRDLGNGS